MAYSYHYVWLEIDDVDGKKFGCLGVTISLSQHQLSISINICFVMHGLGMWPSHRVKNLLMILIYCFGPCIDILCILCLHIIFYGEWRLIINFDRWFWCARPLIQIMVKAFSVHFHFHQGFCLQWGHLINFWFVRPCTLIFCISCTFILDFMLWAELLKLKWLW